MSGNLCAALKPEEADIFIIAVPTPLIADHLPDISIVESFARPIAPFLVQCNMVILESTSPVGTTERIRTILEEERPEFFKEIDSTNPAGVLIADCPEQVLPGQILNKLIPNDRIVGGIEPGQPRENLLI